MTPRRHLKILAIIGVASAGATTLVALGPAALRPWRCHHVVEQPSVHAAVDAYYASCWDSPQHLSTPERGQFGPSSADGVAYAELSVDRGDGNVRFLWVVKQSKDSGWRVLPPEMSGP
jgi:hypothetical protein